MSLFKGSGVAIVTPFHENGDVNYDEFKKLVSFHLENGTDALIVTGTTGESPTTTDDEKLKLYEIAVEMCSGRIPVIAGTGSNNTRHVLHLSKEAEKIGVQGLLLVAPYYNKSTQAGMIEHFTHIADNVNIPIILYNVPGRTGSNIAAETVHALSKHKNIVAVKEASGNFSQVAKIASLVDEDFYIYSGNDDQILPVLSLGGKGVISVLANVAPAETSQMVHDFLNGNIENAIRLQLKYKALIDALFIEVNPIPVKAALNMMGFAAGPLRLPLVELTDKSKVVMADELKKVGL